LSGSDWGLRIMRAVRIRTMTTEFWTMKSLSPTGRRSSRRSRLTCAPLLGAGFGKPVKTCTRNMAARENTNTKAVTTTTTIRNTMIASRVTAEAAAVIVKARVIARKRAIEVNHTLKRLKNSLMNIETYIFYKTFVFLLD
jgi:hypothetical protein